MKDFLKGYGFLDKSVIVVSDKSDLYLVLSFLKSSSLLDYSMLLDMVGLDEGGQMSLRYVLLSVRTGSRMMVSCDVGQEVSSVTGLFKSADWLESEVYDMFGVMFKGHYDMSRILTDYGFKGHPLLKSFEMRMDVSYSDEFKGVKSFTKVAP